MFSAQLIKLNANENPYTPSPRVLAATERLRLYPDPGASALRAAVAARCGVAPGEVFVGIQLLSGPLRPLWHPFRDGAGAMRVQIAALLAEHPDQLVVVDEAYIDFGAESAAPLVARHDTCWSCRRSPSRALAGLRVGFAIGQRPLIEALERVKDSFNSNPLDALARAGAAAAIRDEAWFVETRGRIMAGREALTRDFSALGFEVLLRGLI